jgi:hypothetical protein
MNSCDKSISFSDCELSILRMQVDKAQEKMARRIVSSDKIKLMIEIVEDFLIKKKLICYGGTAINNILPEKEQFYNKEIDIADYDFFTTNGIEDAKELSNLFYKKGFKEVEAKSAIHKGTYKVYVDFIAIADVTDIPKEIYLSLKKEAIEKKGIIYAPPNFLRMSMYLELSRPVGDTSRWEKVFKRLLLLNKTYPITKKKCEYVQFQRKLEEKELKEKDVYKTIRDFLISEQVVFFGGFAFSLYNHYLPNKLKKKINEIADFDVLSKTPKETSEKCVDCLMKKKYENVKSVYHEPIGEIIPEHYEIIINKDTIAFIYGTIGCHSYNTIYQFGKKIKIATIDTILSIYLAFLYTNKHYYTNYSDRFLCMCKFLFDLQYKNRLKQVGLLKRFSITCYGHQKTREDLRYEKMEKIQELKKNSKEYEEWFLNYRPNTNTKSKTKSKTKKTKTKTKKTKKKSKESKKNVKITNKKYQKYIKRKKTMKKNKKTN